jgi:uncharacterized protein YraI
MKLWPHHEPVLSCREQCQQFHFRITPTEQYAPTASDPLGENHVKRMMLGVLLLLSGLPFSAAAQDTAYTTTRVNLRSGPDAAYPRIVTLPAGARIDIYGCIDDWSWCDVRWHRERGWVSAGRLDYSYQDQRYGIYAYGPQLGLPILSFVIGTYWNDYYRNRPWYRERARWSQYRPVYRPRPPSRPPIHILPQRPRPPIQIQPPRPGRPSIQPPRPRPPVTKPAVPRPVTKPAVPRPVTKPAVPRPVTKPAAPRPVTKPAAPRPVTV